MDLKIGVDFASLTFGSVRIMHQIEVLQRPLRDLEDARRCRRAALSQVWRG
ncbi:hypothetical protein [Mesorhizobium sp. WSM3860]|uniref:hypothetical protein n=1 Tax=Mesorhizobium sp. WSM3860 TaxID=2029403 RepID=UPI0015967999|nr:hypothetical protein [Mesorhizobium sp. WSM3860]